VAVGLRFARGGYSSGYLAPAYEVIERHLSSVVPFKKRRENTTSDDFE
jgi:hypothetical protein